jgi:branched-chain amino acid transport system substrate-binding protein
MRAIITSILLLLILILQTSCSDPEPIRIGFLGELTTRASGLSTSARDGFLLAIEEINARGGINNRPVEGITQDTRMHKETALNALRKLAEQKVSVIIGPMTSQTAVTVVGEANRLEIPLISPTSSTNKLSGLDDYFFRVYYTNAQAAQLLAKRIVVDDKLKSIAAIYDLGNKAYTEDWVHHFTEIAEQHDGSVSRIPFELSSNTLFLDIAKQAAASEPQAIIILANAVDTAMLCQQLAKTNVELPRYATGWSYSDDLLHFGGKSVEGLAVIQSANMQSPTKQSAINFVKAYQGRYSNTPNFPAMHAYDATTIALEVLKKSSDPKIVRRKLLSMSTFPGVQDQLAFDRYGDQKDPSVHLAHIIDGKFVISD